jgi:hypothetical protein
MNSLALAAASLLYLVPVVLIGGVIVLVIG